MDAVIVTKKKDQLSDAEKVERLAKRYWWAIVILGISTGVFCKLYVIYHCRHHHVKKKYRQLKVKHRHLEWQHGRLTFVDDAPQSEDTTQEPFIDRDADESVAKQGWAAIRHAVKGTKAQKLGGIVREASRKDVENPVRNEHHISQALTDAKREHAAHLLKIADLEDELRVSRLNVTPDRGDSASESGFTEAMHRAPPAPSPRGPPAPPTPPPPVHRTPGSPATPHVDLE